MGRLIQLSDLREAVRQRYDLGNFSSSSWASTPAINASINSSLQEFYALLLDCSGDEYFGTTEDLTTFAGIELTSLPARFIRLHNLVWLRGTDDVVEILPAAGRDARLSGLQPQDWDAWAPRYRLHGMNAIRWLPTPAQAYTVRCTYSALPADLVEDDDSFDAGPGWEQWVIADVCAKLAEREEKDASAFYARRADAEARVRSSAPIRTDATPNLFTDRPAVDEMSAWQLRDLVTRVF